MTSVGVVSSVVERMKCLKKLEKNSGSLPKEAEGLLNDLAVTQGLLAAAYDGGVEPGAQLEKEVVRISYDVVYTITDALKPATGMFDQLKIGGGSSKLEKLKVQLQPFIKELKQKVHPDKTAGPAPDPDSSAAASPALGEAGDVQTAEDQSSGGQSKTSFIQKVKNMTDKVMNMAAGSDERPADQSEEDKTHLRSRLKTTLTTEMSKDDSSVAPSEKAGAKQLKTKESHQSAGQTIMNVGKMKPESTAGQGKNMAAGSDDMSGSNTNKGDKTQLQNRLKTNLTTEISKKNPQEMYIMGKSGMGKSTLAKELYDDEEIRKSFKAFGWVSVGRNFRIKRVLQLLLQELGRWQEDKQQQLDLREMNEIELISRISDVVKDKPYLLVLEDICSKQDWENIRLALPFANSTCRVIITTASNGFSPLDNCHEILGLTHSETLALLNNEADFDSEVGEAIARISGGSPLYAAILAKSLKSEAKNKNLVEELRSYESMEGTYHVLGACYKRLPPALKPCFLYLGQLPPGHDIPVTELYLLLAAEMLIMPPERDAEISPQTLMDNLKALADLKLIQVEEDPQSSETRLYNSCRLHGQVREFCNWQGQEEEFHLTVDFERPEEQVVEPHTHRLAIYLNKYKGDATTFVFKENDTARKILSLLIFDAFDSAEEKPVWPSEMDDLASYAHLRVLIFEEVNFKLRKFPKGLEKLNPLRFLSFRGCYLKELPSSLSSLKQLETLDLRVRDDCNVIIPSNVFTGMKRMVHLHLPRLYQKKGKNKVMLQGLEMLETLTNFDTEVFEVADLSQFTRLKDLSTVSNGQSPKDIDSVVSLLNERKKGLQHSSVEIKSFDCYDGDNISALRKLLQCRFVRSVKVEGQIEELPDPKAKLSQNEEADGDGGRLAEMFLDGSELEDNPMEYFGKFRNLRSLTLANDAFIGDVLVIPAKPLFPNLRILKLQNLHYLDKLEIREGAMPKLSSLRIESCGASLELTIPEELYKSLKKKKTTGGDGYSVVPAPSKLITTP